VTGDLVSGFGLPPRFTTIVVGRRSQFLLADTRSFFSSRTFVVVHAACFSYATGSGSVLGTDWLQETSTHVSVCEMPRTMQPVYSPACLACLPDGKDLFCCELDYSRCCAYDVVVGKKCEFFQVVLLSAGG